jgi:hypothetical protein
MFKKILFFFPYSQLVLLPFRKVRHFLQKLRLAFLPATEEKNYILLSGTQHSESKTLVMHLMSFIIMAILIS